MESTTPDIKRQDDRAILRVEHLTTTMQLGGAPVVIVDDVSFQLERGKTVCLMGESGCGKSITALSLMRLLPRPPAIASTGAVWHQDRDLLTLKEPEMRLLRGRKLAMIFQDPMSALNPVYSIGDQLLEVVGYHLHRWGEEAINIVVQALDNVGIPAPEQRLGEYPHQLSGGMKQRVMIAMALLCEPDVLIADEPTTALDVTVQAQVLDLMRALVTRSNAALLLITHDMGVVAEMADEVIVMYRGQAIERGLVEPIFDCPQHPHTQRLFAARPQQRASIQRSEQNRALEPILKVRELTKHFSVTRGLVRRRIATCRAVDGISFTLHRGEVLGIVGESGCGKSTLARAAIRLIEPTSGQVQWMGDDLLSLSSRQLRKWRPKVQMVFQDPLASLNPRMTVAQNIGEAVRFHQFMRPSEIRSLVLELLYRVELPATSADRYPHQFSGGQQQRICIARALALNPEVLVCDEAVSALDLSVQAQILALVQELRHALDLSVIFISHDLGVVRYLCDRVLVLYAGRVVERGPTESLFQQPHHPYTKALLSAIPKQHPRETGNRILLHGDPPSPLDMPGGCPFYARCSLAQPECAEAMPPDRQVTGSPTHTHRCIR